MRFKFYRLLFPYHILAGICGFLPVWNDSCVCNLLLCKSTLSHFEQVWDFIPVWTKSCVTFWADMWFFLQCGLIHVFSNLPSVKIPCHILSRHEVYIQCGLIHVLSNLPSVKMPCHILSKHEVYIQCGFIHVWSNLPSVKMPCHTLSKYVAFHLSGLIHVISNAF